MAIESIPVKSIWSWAGKIFPFLVRYFYTNKKMADLVYVDIRPRHDPVEVQLGECPSFSLYLQIINLSPFPVELDRANFSFSCGSANTKTSVLEKKVIASGEIASLYLHEEISGDNADQIAKYAGETEAALDGNIEFNCKVRSFAKKIGRLGGINPRYVNVHLRKGE